MTLSIWQNPNGCTVSGMNPKVNYGLYLVNNHNVLILVHQL